MDEREKRGNETRAEDNRRMQSIACSVFRRRCKYINNITVLTSLSARTAPKFFARYFYGVGQALLFR